MMVKMVVMWIYPNTMLVMILQSQPLAESHGVVLDQGGKTKGNHPKVQAGLIHPDLAGHVLAHLLEKGVNLDLAPVI